MSEMQPASAGVDPKESKVTKSILPSEKPDLASNAVKDAKLQGNDAEPKVKTQPASQSVDPKESKVTKSILPPKKPDQAANAVQNAKLQVSDAKTNVAPSSAKKQPAPQRVNPNESKVTKSILPQKKPDQAAKAVQNAKSQVSDAKTNVKMQPASQSEDPNKSKVTKSILPPKKPDQASNAVQDAKSQVSNAKTNVAPSSAKMQPAPQRVDPRKSIGTKSILSSKKPDQASNTVQDAKLQVSDTKTNVTPSSAKTQTAPQSVTSIESIGTKSILSSEKHDQASMAVQDATLQVSDAEANDAPSSAKSQPAPQSVDPNKSKVTKSILPPKKPDQVANAGQDAKSQVDDAKTNVAPSSVKTQSVPRSVEPKESIVTKSILSPKKPDQASNTVQNAKLQVSDTKTNVAPSSAKSQPAPQSVDPKESKVTKRILPSKKPDEAANAGQDAKLQVSGTETNIAPSSAKSQPAPQSVDPKESKVTKSILPSKKPDEAANAGQDAKLQVSGTETNIAPSSAKTQPAPQSEDHKESKVTKSILPSKKPDQAAIAGLDAKVQVSEAETNLALISADTQPAPQSVDPEELKLTTNISTCEESEQESAVQDAKLQASNAETNVALSSVETQPASQSVDATESILTCDKSEQANNAVQDAKLQVESKTEETVTTQNSAETPPASPELNMTKSILSPEESDQANALEDAKLQVNEAETNTALRNTGNNSDQSILIEDTDDKTDATGNQILPAPKIVTVNLKPKKQILSQVHYVNALLPRQHEKLHRAHEHLMKLFNLDTKLSLKKNRKIIQIKRKHIFKEVMANHPKPNCTVIHISPMPSYFKYYHVRGLIELFTYFNAMHDLVILSDSMEKLVGIVQYKCDSTPCHIYIHPGDVHVTSCERDPERKAQSIVCEALCRNTNSDTYLIDVFPSKNAPTTQCLIRFIKKCDCFRVFSNLQKLNIMGKKLFVKLDLGHKKLYARYLQDPYKKKRFDLMLIRFKEHMTQASKMQGDDDEIEDVNDEIEDSTVEDIEDTETNIEDSEEHTEDTEEHTEDTEEHTEDVAKQPEPSEESMEIGPDVDETSSQISDEGGNDSLTDDEDVVVLIKNLPQNKRFLLHRVIRENVGKHMNYFHRNLYENGILSGSYLLKFLKPEDAKFLCDKINGMMICGREIEAKLQKGSTFMVDHFKTPNKNLYTLKRKLSDVEHETKKSKIQKVNLAVAYMPPEPDVYDTYGLKIDFLKKLGIKPPLHSKICVRNLHFEVTEAKLLEVFSLAGEVKKIEMSNGPKGQAAFIEYDHPVEAVQAISLFKGHKLYEREMKVTMDILHEQRMLPLGLSSIGQGLGPDGLPLRGVRSKIEVKKLGESLFEVGKMNRFRDPIKTAPFAFNYRPAVSTCDNTNTPKASNTNRNAPTDNSETKASCDVVEALGTALICYGIVPPGTDCKDFQSIMFALQNRQSTSNTTLNPEANGNFTPQQKPFSNRPSGPRGPNPKIAGPRGPNWNMSGPRGPNPRGPNWNKSGPRGPNPNMAGPRGPNWNMSGPRGPNPNMAGSWGPNPNMASQWGPNTNMAGQWGPNPNAAGPWGPNPNMAGPNQNIAGSRGSTATTLLSQTENNPNADPKGEAIGQAMQQLMLLMNSNTMTPAMMQQHMLQTMMQANMMQSHVANQNPTVGQNVYGLVPNVNQNATSTTQAVIEQPAVKYDNQSKWDVSQSSAPVTYVPMAIAPPMALNMPQHKPHSSPKPAKESKTKETKPEEDSSSGVKKADTLMFKYLPSSVTADALASKMREIGDLLFSEKTGKGRAVVRFKNPEDAQKCYRLFHNSKVDGQIIEVKII